MFKPNKIYFLALNELAFLVSFTKCVCLYIIDSHFCCNKFQLNCVFFFFFWGEKLNCVIWLINVLLDNGNNCRLCCKFVHLYLSSLAFHKGWQKPI